MMAGGGDGDTLALALRRYASEASPTDLMLGSGPDMAARWTAMLAGLSAPDRGGFTGLQERAARQVVDLGMAFRLAGEADERPWPLSPVPLLIPAVEWQAIERGAAQRADVLEAVIADIYGPGKLVADGHLPAAVVTGSPDYWRQMIGRAPPRGHRLQFYALDLARGPDGGWRVLADHVRTPMGAGYAIENRLAMTRATNDLLSHMNVRRLAPFFASFRQGLAACCERVDPRIALLTPGRFNPSYPEQAHLARYLGLLLVEGEDLTVEDGRLYVRTIEGLKRIDALWRRLDTRLLDPLAFDSRSKIGVPDLFEVLGQDGLAVANWPGAGVVESPALGAFLPKLARALLGVDLKLPNIATWWCGQPREQAIVRAGIGHMAIGSAFGRSLPSLPDGQPRMGARLGDTERALLLDDMGRRPMDYVGQELVQLSTTPALIGGALAARPFVLRAFLARDADGAWRTMPGGFARLAAHEDIRAVLMGGGDMSADVCIVSDRPETSVSLLDTSPSPAIRRVAGTLPSKAADNFFWLSRYLERGEMVLRMVRALLGGTIEVDAASGLQQTTLDRVADMLVEWGAAPRAASKGGVAALCASAIGDTACSGSAHALFQSAETIGLGLRERLAVDVWRLLSHPLRLTKGTQAEALIEHAARGIDRCAALSGLAAENMVRGHGWIFHDMGRRIERAIHLCRLVRVFARGEASSDDLGLLLDLCDCQISFRTRYLSGLALMPVRDMLLLEPENPRSLVFQISSIVRHLGALPTLRDDGMPEPPVRIATALAAMLAASTAETLDDAGLERTEKQLYALSDAIGDRFFLHGRERAAGMSRLA
ncbi:circularly permuted type 2 ATP-grasp protein [Sphingomonas abietis]|uniref:Circularly permuted type 2 ATP-grasp protein n=1 Tax=Sphingomonas abietis TaxID=3012344 RepID=A0ABY7NRB5_9SPHN|nr:circularly permuted type 2 ATP-grasp protein [Sphingomonas abietis]WBO24053.1 circularly permuted type 2 ATP-grasp protein [Sphingomonas abietis]